MNKNDVVCVRERERAPSAIFSKAQAPPYMWGIHSCYYCRYTKTWIVVNITQIPQIWTFEFQTLIWTSTVFLIYRGSWNGYSAEKKGLLYTVLFKVCYFFILSAKIIFDLKSHHQSVSSKIIKFPLVQPICNPYAKWICILQTLNQILCNSVLYTSDAKLNTVQFS